MTEGEIQVGDVVRAKDDTKPWRVDGRNRAGKLTLEALHTINRVVWRGVHESQVRKSSVYR